MVLINPEITEHEDFAVGREGCMLVPDFTGNVIRAGKISALDEYGGATRVYQAGGLVCTILGRLNQSIC